MLGKKPKCLDLPLIRASMPTDICKKSLRASPKSPAVDELFCLALMDIPSLSTFYKRASNGFKYLGPKIFGFCYLLINFFSILHSGNRTSSFYFFCSAVDVL